MRGADIGVGGVRALAGRARLPHTAVPGACATVDLDVVARARR
jgi:hypothetical protein